MVGWWRNQRDAGDAVTCLRYHFVHLEAGQLTAFSRLCALCHLDLNLLRVDEIFRGYAETSAGHLLGLAVQADAVHFGVEPGRVLTALACVRPAADLVHGQADRLVCLLAQCAKRHGTSHEMLHDGLHGLYFVHGDGALFPREEVTDEYG